MSSQCIISKLPDIPPHPGVYQFFSKSGEVLYIGKAKNLQKRVAYYTKPDLSLRLSRMVFLVENLEYVVTRSEPEALILEARLIKKLQPKYNILLKDDKSFPYIVLRMDHDYPQIFKKRSKVAPEGKYFGPFASSEDVDVTILELQKIFKLRSCSDNYFEGRKRPCLQYQIKRCQGPCVQKVTHEEYMVSVREVEDFLSGKLTPLQKELASRMEACSEDMEYEKAAALRDKIKALSYVQLKYGRQELGVKTADILMCSSKNDTYAILIAFYRNGQYFGNKIYFPEGTEGTSAPEVLACFIEQFYLDKERPEEIIVNHDPGLFGSDGGDNSHVNFYNIKITCPARGSKLQLLQSFENSLEQALQLHVKKNIQNRGVLEEVQKLFDLEDIPRRIEVYDNSHIMGKHAIGAMIVAGQDGFIKKEYRAYNLESSSSTGGDDYAMLGEVMTRRLNKILESLEEKPDLMIIDGGKGQMSTVESVMNKTGVHIPFVCMSKGPDRNAGLEQFHMVGREVFTLGKDDKLMHYLQVLRDEAHNFAIKKHRAKRARTMRSSALDSIDGLGPKRKKDLLHVFGSIEGIKNANASEVAKIGGIGIAIAERILEALRVH
ncbi:MAG: excinuclease ABC subunit UvrC [Pseudomonadota bacterium]